MSKKSLKKIVFHSSFEEQKIYSQQFSIGLSVEERLAEMYRLNRKLYGINYGKLSKTVELFVGLPGESVKDFRKRINGDA